MITLAQLRQIMPNLSLGKAQKYLPHIQAAMSEFEISHGLERAAAFLAQLAHESGELRWMEELASGSAYEGRHDLGNTHPGDGRRYKGRGPIQITGRANYARYGKLLGLDLIEHPEQAASPEVGFRLAGAFWKTHDLNRLADEHNFREITRRINGGYTHEAERETYYRRALKVLGE